MDLSELKKLKSGTDIRGVATGENKNLTDEALSAIVKAFCVWLVKTRKIADLKIAVGNDSRISSPHISDVVEGALIGCGAEVIYTGLSSTPSMFILLKESGWGCNASIMITASHLPYDRNGLKFFTAEGGLSGENIDEILQIAAVGNFPQAAGRYFERSFMDDYSRILVEKVENACGKEPLKGKKIIVDAGNGAGGFFAEKVLKPLGADTDGSLYLEPDGYFPHHIPNPENQQAIDCISRAVIKENADLGIIFDTDVDRAACVDSDGNEINRNSLIALLASVLLPDKGGVIVTDSETSVHLTEFINGLGGEHYRYKRGYKNVIDKCKELNAQGKYSPLAIETSGHAAFAENYFLDDGAYLITKILICLSGLAAKGEKISSLIAMFKKPAEETEVRIGFNEQSRDFTKEGEKVMENIEKFVKNEEGLELSPDNREGVRFIYPNGATLIRMSVHDPVMPVYMESDVSGGNREAAVRLYSLLKDYKFLDLTPLHKYISEQPARL